MFQIKSTYKSIREKGFTLVELLVVISIISFLSSVILASLSTARMKARDAQRIEGLHQMQTALELYYNTHGYYPYFPPWGHGHQTLWNVNKGDGSYPCGINPSKWCGWDWDTNTLYSLVTEGYIPSLPQDPLAPNYKNSGCTDSFAGGKNCIGSGYFPMRSGTCYVLGANLEQENLNTHKNSSGSYSGCGGYQISGGCKCSDVEDLQYGTID